MNSVYSVAKKLCVLASKKSLCPLCLCGEKSLSIPVSGPAAQNRSITSLSSLLSVHSVAKKIRLPLWQNAVSVLSQPDKRKPANPTAHDHPAQNSVPSMNSVYSVVKNLCVVSGKNSLCLCASVVKSLSIAYN